MNQRKFFFFSVLFVLCSCFGFAQPTHTVNIVFTDTSNRNYSPPLPEKKNYTSFTQIHQSLKTYQQNLIEKGYLAVSIDSVNNDSSKKSVTAYVHSGKIYKWAQLLPPLENERILSEIAYREKLYTHKPFSPAQLSKLFAHVLDYCENNGYPFASVGLDSVQLQEETIKARLVITTGKYISLDSIIVMGNLLLQKKFLFHYLQIKEKNPYNEGQLKKIGERIRQLPFVKENKSQLVRITDKQTKLYLFLDKKNASQFDGILGLLPDAKGQTIFTGDVRIKLMNAVFKSGELLDLNWRRLQSQTQDLKLKLNYPYLFNSPVGTEYSLKIYKRDTTFIDIQNNLGLQYLFAGLNYVKVFYRQKVANLLSTSGLENITVLPEFADILTNAYGLGVFLEQYDYKLNPRKGFWLSANASAGNRSIKKNTRINPVVYNSIRLNSVQYQAETEAGLFIPLFDRSTIKLGTQFGTIFSEPLFKNELFRIGGLKTFRGVDEESIFASTFTVSTLEYRFLFEQNSSIYLFGDVAWYEDNGSRLYLQDMPYSIGAGINFETKAGIFSLNYALGKQFGNPIDLRTGKIHFGIVNSF